MTTMVLRMRRWRIVEVGNRRRRRRRCPARSGRRRRQAVPEPGPVPPVDVHVPPEGLRRPELPLAEAAGVGSRRPSDEAAAPPWLLLLLLVALPLHGTQLEAGVDGVEEEIAV